MADDGQYKFSLTLDNTKFELNIEQAKKAFASLTKQAQDAGAKIDNIPNPFEKLGNGAPVVQETTRQFNGLNFATQQIVRELPAMSMGFNTFFLAVSNNLPILADQIKVVNAQNAEMAAQGLKPVPVLKQLGKAIFSWQSALMLGVTALSMFGDKIGGWFSSLFRSRRELTAAEKAQRAFNKAIKDGGLGIGDDVVQLKKLSDAYRQFGEDMSSKNKFIRDNASEFDKLGVAVRSVQEADNLLINNTDAFIEAMRKRAMASAARKLAEEQYDKVILKDIEIEDLENKLRQSKMSAYMNYSGNKDALYKILFDKENDFDDMLEQFTELLLADDPEARELVEERGEAARDAVKKIAASQLRIVREGMHYMQGLKEQREELNKEFEEYFKFEERYLREEGDILKDSNIDTNTEAVREAEAQYDKIMRERKALREAVASEERKAQDEEIAAIDDKAEAIDRRIRLAYERRKAEIKRQERELKEAVVGRELTDEEAQNTQLSGEDKAMIDRLHAYNEQALQAGQELVAKVRAEQLKTSKAAMNDYLIEYGTLQERILATQEKYSQAILDAKTEGERRVLEAERDALLAEYEVMASAWAQGLVNKSVAELKSMALGLQAALKSLEEEYQGLATSDSEQAKNILDVINHLKPQIGLVNNLLDNGADAATNDKWAESKQVFQNITRSANDAASALEEYDEGLANALRGMANLSSAGVNLIAALEGVKVAFKATAEGASALERASAILAAIGAAIQVVTTIISSIREAFDDSEYQATLRQFRVLNTELERMHRLMQLDSSKGNIFGDNAFGNFSTNLKVVREQLEAYGKTQDAIISRGKEVWVGWEGRPDRGIANHTWGSLSESIANMQVKTRDRSGFAEFFGATDEYASLGELLPELFAGGEVSLAGLEQLAESDVYDKLTQENRDLIDQLIAEWQGYEDAMSAVNDYLKGIFGDLGNTMTDALVDAFENGTDAALAFGEAAGDMLEQLAEDMVSAALIQPLIEEAQAQIDAMNKEALSPEARIAGIIDIVGGLISDVAEQSEDVNQALEEVRRRAAERGIDLWTGDERSASSKGVAQASQDSVNELNGRATAIQSHTYAIMRSQEQLTRDSANILRHIVNIDNNTQELRQMRNDMSAMRSDINAIATRGITLR